MGTIIEWANWAQAQEAIANTSKAVSGMSPAEAEAALNWSKTTLKDGTIRYIHNASSGAGGSNVVQFPGASASDAFNSYVGDGGLSSSGGAAVSNPTSAQSSNLTMLKGAAGTTGIGAILSMNLPTAAAAIAPLAGVALGVGLYELNPGLWEKISRALLPFCYDDSELLPVVADEEGNTYFPKGAVDALKNVILEENVPGAISDISGISAWKQPIKYFEGNKILFSYWANNDKKTHYVVIETQTPVRAFGQIWPNNKLSNGTMNIVFSLRVISDKSFVSRSSSTTDGFADPTGTWYPSTKGTVHGKPIYNTKYGGGIYGSLIDIVYDRIEIKSINVPINKSTIEDRNLTTEESGAVSYTVLYGDSAPSPEGLSNWTGSSYPDSPSQIEVITNIDGETITTQPYYPISTPIGDPGTSVNPDDTPDITKNPNPGPAINPWISPNPSPVTYPPDVPGSNPAPLPNPVPDYTPNLDPETDPSQEPAPEPDPAEQLPKPGDSGTSPTPQIPIIPTPPSTATGLLHVYNPTQTQLDSFGSWLWTTFSGDLIDTLSKLFNDPMDAVIGLHELYTTPAVSGQATIRAGYLDSGVASNIVGSRYTSINCGSVVVPEFYSNYLDYSPYTKCYIYLPFVGIVPVLADDIIGNAVNITYHIDSYTGCCIAVVTVAREGYSSTVYQFEGNCAVEIPITSGYQSTLVGAMLGIAGTAISGSPHVGLAASNLGRANLGKNDASHSGSFGASYGAMGAKIPYIIVKRPTQKSVVNYNQEYGFPAHTRVTIGACSGYLRAREVHVISPTATDEEKARIEELLKGGVFVK